MTTTAPSLVRALEWTEKILPRLAPVGALMLTALAATASCANSSGVATYIRPEAGSQMGLLVASIRYEGGCLYLDAVDGQKFLPVFESSLDARWRDEELKVGDHSFAAGVTVEVGGTVVSDDVPLAEQSIPDACDSGVSRWAVASMEPAA